MNKKAGEQAKDLIFHQWRFNNLPHEFTITVLHSINTQSINTLYTIIHHSLCKRILGNSMLKYLMTSLF